MKRFLDLCDSDLANMTNRDILTSIQACEGRVLISEFIAPFPALLGDVSNPELACAFGADIILVNMYDVDKPFIFGVESPSPLKRLQELTGRVIGVNLEPVDDSIRLETQKINISKGRYANPENVRKLIEEGVRMVVLTGNPSTGVSTKKIAECARNIKSQFDDEIIVVAGKMHNSGMNDEMGTGLMNEDIIDEFVEAGVDIILIPAPATIPGFGVERVARLVEHIHKRGKMSLTAIGTSQEGADEDTIRRIALYSKMAGTDMHHIGDCGMSPGMATPENIMHYSIAIRGKRHTYRVMGRSIRR